MAQSIMKRVNKKLEVVETKKYACGGCGRKRRRSSAEPWRQEDKHGKIVWKNRAYKILERSLK